MPDRFIDDGRTIFTFGETFLVICPRCGRCAKVVRLQPDLPYPQGFFARRVVCANCGYAKDRREYRAAVGGNHDWFFGLPLWLQTNYRNDLLWAYNAAHLDYLEAFVRAEIREVATHRNRSVASMLPRWLQSGHHRTDILRALARLREMLAET